MIRIIVVIVLILSGWQCAEAQRVLHGKVDLSQHGFGSDSPVELSGTWCFYWNKLLTPADIDKQQNSQWMDVPGSWNVDGPHPPLGFATYRLKLTLPKTENNLSLYFPVINASARVWVNGDLVEELGKTSADQNSYSPKLSSIMIPLPRDTNDLDIVIQVANYSYYHGGIAGTPLLATTSALQAHINTSNGIQNFFAGSLIAMFIFQFILYFLFHRGKPYLWLALICLGTALRALIAHSGSLLLPSLYPSVHWEYWEKIEFGCVYAIVAIFPLYVYNLFPSHAPKKPLIVFITIAVVLCSVVLVRPQHIYGRLLEVCHAGLLLGFIYAVYTIGSAWKSGNTDAKIILLGVLAAFPFILAEILKNSVLSPINIKFSHLAESGVLVFLLFQVYLLANQNAKSFKSLEVLNQNLERIVAERTTELTTTNAVKDRLLSIMSHDIKSPLNALRDILQLYKNQAISKQELGDFTQRVEGDLSKTNLLVENILYWTANQLKGIQIRPEKFNINLIIEENIQLFKSVADAKRIIVYNSTPDKITATADRNILNFVIRNLMANAIKYSYEGGTVTISTHVANHVLTIEVKDQGIGMNEETIHTLLTPDRSMSTAGTHLEKGTGMGLVLCREYLQIVGGALTIESTLGKGSAFSISIPL